MQNNCTCDCRHLLRQIERANEIGTAYNHNSMLSFDHALQIFDTQESQSSCSQFLIENISGNEALQKVLKLNQCQCCTRHHTNRPVFDI